MDGSNHSIILFDGVCNLCNGSVNFIMDRDTEDEFRFGALQSDAGQRLLDIHQIDRATTDSVILIEDNKPYTYSSAALRIARKLGGIWSIAYVFIVVPRILRDPLYKLVARNRYRMFGKSDVCRIPTPETAIKFI